jgi:PAS domain S-box-containing protein
VSGIKFRGKRHDIAHVTSPRDGSATDALALDSVLAGVLAATDEGVLVLDAGGLISTINPAAQRLLGYGSEELLGLSICGSVAAHHQGEDGCRPGSCRLLEAEPIAGSVRRCDDVFTGRGGARVPVAVGSVTVGGADRTLGHVVVFRDISERSAAEELERRELEEVSWIGCLREAMDEDRLVLAAQPIISLTSGEVARHELLVRLRDRDGGLVLPAEFLAAAERFGLVGRLDRWVVRRAARMTAKGQAVSVNLSAHSLRSPELASLIEGVLRAEDADPTLLMFELTEDALSERPLQARRFLERMAALGCELAVDDIGSCDGAFSYLDGLPIGYLKLDPALLVSLPDAATSRHLVAAVVSLAKRLGQQTIAEGIEDLATLEAVRELGVDFAQGYYIAPPGGSPRSEILRHGTEADAVEPPPPPRRTTGLTRQAPDSRRHARGRRPA